MNWSRGSLHEFHTRPQVQNQSIQTFVNKSSRIDVYQKRAFGRILFSDFPGTESEWRMLLQANMLSRGKDYISCNELERIFSLS